MFCKNCGKQLPDGAKFCAGCGTPVERPAIPQEPETPLDLDEVPADSVPGEDVPAPNPSADESPASEEEYVIPDEIFDVPQGIFDDAEQEEPASEEAPAASPAQSDAPQEAPADVPAYNPGYMVPSAETAVPKRRGRAGVFVVLGVAAVVVIALVVLAVKFLPGALGGGKAPAVAYLNDDNELMYLADLKEKTQALELTDDADYGAGVTFSPDGKTVYFKDDEDSLYAIAVSELKKGGKAQRISRDVDGFFVLKDGKVVYLQYDNGENKLSVYDKGESYRLARGYSGYQLSEDEKTLYYTERDEYDDTLALYRIAVAKDAKEERLLKGATYIYTSYSSDVLVYGVEDSGSSDDNNILTVYSCTPGGEKNKLVSNVYSVAGISVSGGKVSFYYYKEEREKRALYDFVTDNKAGEDASTLQMPEPEYPVWSDYAIDELWVNDDLPISTFGVVYYTTWNGDEISIDISSLLNGTGITKDDLYYMYNEIYDIAYDDAQQRYNQAQEDYNAWYDVWWEAEYREELRSELKSSQYDQSTLSLYQYADGGKGDPLATGIAASSRVSAPFDGIFLYHKADLAGGKVADVDDLNYADEVWELLSSGSGGEDDEWYQNVGGKESKLDLDEVEGIYNIYVLNSKEVVLDVYNDDYDNSLLSFTLGKDALTFHSAIVDEGDEIRIVQDVSGGKDVLYLFTDMEEDGYNRLGDFSVYRDGKLETIAKGIYEAVILKNSGTTYLVTDMDDRNGTGEMALLKDGKQTRISDEVEGDDIVFLNDAQLLYIEDGDLTLWNGKESRRIARDVEAFWSSIEEGVSMYSAW